jgi:long-chain acyl-CoA synthetase
VTVQKPPPPAVAVRGALQPIVDRLLAFPDRELWLYDGPSVVRKTYREVHADVLAVAEKLRGAGVRPRCHVGILAENSYGWVVMDLALLSLDAVSVAFAIESERQRSVMELKSQYRLSLLILSPAELETRRSEAADHAWIASLDDLTGLRSEDPGPDEQTSDADVFSLAFSSGTSGRPKAIHMSASGTTDAMEEYQRQLRLRPDDAILVVLPLSAFPQRLMVFLAIWIGFSIRLADIPRLQPALRDMQPTIVVGPPAFYEMIEARYRLIPADRRRRLDALRRVIGVLPPRVAAPLQRRLFANAHAILGGRARLLLTGAAPARVSTLDLVVSLGLPLFEFYGLTETSVITWNLPRARRHGSVGRALRPGCVQLAPDGEILARFDPARSKGYYGLPAEEDALTFRPDGWIATGDLGRFDDDGYLYVVGRKKSVVITRTGYKLQPEPVERALLEHPAVAHAAVIGGEFAPTVTAVCSLRPDASDDVQRELERILDQVGADVPAPARVTRVVCTPEPFTPVNGLLTRTMKPDRAAIGRHFQDVLSPSAEQR